MAEAVQKSWLRRRSLFGKYVVSFVMLVVLVLGANSVFETWFTYSEVTQLLSSAQSEKAEAIARRIEQFVDDIERQINSATRASSTTLTARQSDYEALLQQVPAIDRVILLDSTGKEQLRTTRDGSVSRSGIDYSSNPRFTETKTKSIWFSPVYFDGPDPFMTIAMRHSGRNVEFDCRRDQSQVPVELFRSRNSSERTPTPMSSGRPDGCWRTPIRVPAWAPN